MNSTLRRICAYGLAIVVAGGLLYNSYIKEHRADPMTLLGSAQVQLQLCQSFPEKDKEGRPNPARVSLLAKVRDFIREARVQAPELHAGIELDAHLNWAEGDFPRAAQLFREASTCPDATPESGVIDRLNEARMWRAAEQPAKALESLDSLSEFLVPQVELMQVYRVDALRKLDRRDEASAIALRLSRSSTNSEVLTSMGEVLESHNETEAAEAAYRNAAIEKPLANYFLARLKIREREFDTGLDLLKKAVAADGDWTRNMVSRDSTDWDQVREDQRFRDLNSSTSEAAPAGR